MSHSDLFRFPPLLACRPPRLLLERFLFRDLNHDSLEEEVEELEEEVVVLSMVRSLPLWSLTLD